MIPWPDAVAERGGGARRGPGGAAASGRPSTAPKGLHTARLVYKARIGSVDFRQNVVDSPGPERSAVSTAPKVFAGRALNGPADFRQNADLC